MATLGGISFRDLKLVSWGDTLKLAVLRSLSAGVAWGVLAAFIHPPEMRWYQPLVLMPLGVPLAYFFYLPFGLTFSALANAGIPFVGLGSLPLMFFTAIGDPILKLLSTQQADLVPCDNFRLFNFVGVIFVMKNTDAHAQSPHPAVGEEMHARPAISEAVTLAGLAAHGGTVQKIKQLDVADQDWAAIVTLPFGTRRPVGSAVVYGRNAGGVEAMLFESQEPDFKSIDDHVMTVIFEKTRDGAWSVRERQEP